MTAEKLIYRRDINGLRALAVTSVVLFHADKSLVRGGFVGVDIFFVISGYLISRILLSEINSGAFRLADFYAKRIKRIFPALTLVLFSVWVAGWVLMDPQEFLELGRHELDGAFFILNFRLMGENNYFDIASMAKPLLHLWSLSIEEQFYIVWPVLLLALSRFRRAVAPAIILVFAISLALNLVLTQSAPSLAFYLPWSRAWELALGAALAYRELFLRAPDAGAAAARRRNLAVLAGVALMLGAIFLLDEGQPFPGWRALLPTFGCGLVLANPGSAWSERIFGQRIAQVLGDISYPLYLWHWPLLSFAALRFPGATTPATLALLIALAVLLAGLTFLLLEKAATSQFAVRRPQLVATLVLALVASGFLGRWATLQHGFPARYPEQVARIFNFQYHGAPKLGAALTCFDGRFDVPLVDDYSEKTFLEFGRSQHCFSVDDPSKPTIVIIGDSHAAHLSSGVAAEFGARANIVNLNAHYCVPLVDPVEPGNGRAGTQRCAILNRVRSELVKQLKPDLLIVGAYFWQYLDDPAWRYPDYLEAFRAGVEEFHAAGVSNILIAGEVPTWTPTLPAVIAREFLAHKPINVTSSDGLRTEALSVDGRLRDQPWPPGVSYISMADGLCSPKGCRRLTGETVPDDLIAIDYGHLSDQGSLYVARHILGPAIRRALLPEISAEQKAP